jgi:hypothetical protein
MSNQMQRVAELEAQVAALTAERDALKEKQSEFDLQDHAEQICYQIKETERRLRDDFIGKFAANFLLATEAVTNRLTAAEARESQIEERQRALQAEFENHLSKVRESLAETHEWQKGLVRWFHDYIEKYRATVEAVLEAQLEGVRDCNKAAAATAEAARMCSSFAKDYEAVAAAAKQGLSGFSAQAKRGLGEYMDDLKAAIDHAVTPVLRRVEYLTEAQFKRRAWLLAAGLVTGLVFSSVFLWLTQPPRAVERDAQRWRSLTNDLNREQYEKVTGLLNEIERQRETAPAPSAHAPR